MRYWKVTNQEEKHHGLQHHDGLVIDPIPFNPSGSCAPGGIYYADEDHICEFLGYGPWVREVIVPDDARTYADPEGNKFKSDRVILGEKIPVEDFLLDYIDRHNGSIPGNLSIYSDAKLEALTSVGGYLSIYSDAKLEANALTSVGGYLYIDSDAKLEANALTSVGGYLYHKK